MPCVGVLNNRAVGYFMSGAVVKDSFVLGLLISPPSLSSFRLILIGACRTYD